MKAKTFFSALFIIASVITNAQVATINWQNTIGGNAREGSRTIQQTSDGGSIIAGVSESNASGDKTENSQGEDDLWIVKLNSVGALEWENTIGGSAMEIIQSHGTSIQQTSDGGYIIGCNSNSNISGDKTENSNGDFDFWIIKLNSSGEIEWQNTIGGSNVEIFGSIINTSDGGYILGGSSNSNISGDKNENSKGSEDYWVLKLNSSGNIEWQKTIGGNAADQLEELKPTADGGYILGGWSISGISGDKSEAPIGAWDYWIVKIDSSGNIEWENTIGGDDVEYFSQIFQTNDGGYILSGDSLSNISGDKSENSNGENDFWIIKLNNLGEIEWENTIGGSDLDSRPTAFPAEEGGYIVAGSSWSNISGDKTENSKGEQDIWILKLNDLGEIEWQKTIGGNSSDWVFDIIQNNDGSYTIGGNSYSNISGDKTENSKGASDYWIVNFSTILGVEENPTINTITLYPNPANSVLYIKNSERIIDSLIIYSPLGKIIDEFTVNNNSAAVDISGLATGIYYITLKSGNDKTIKKFVKK
ncbi:T9SS type A sorting domain-containing protein [Vitellibacter sp. q18]|nr:T9SS type A sorting domain-containing protein [Aequorivita lutea]